MVRYFVAQSAGDGKEESDWKPGIKNLGSRMKFADPPNAEGVYVSHRFDRTDQGDSSPRATLL
jgi:hypothetical protein